MTDVLVHRGPDDSGHLLLDSATGSFSLDRNSPSPRSIDLGLGSRRLSIIDLSPAGRQPMANETGDVFVVHNGEIYNHVELRALLEAHGHVFRSRTDTEVIVHAYEQWGHDCVARFNGMWAFAIWDQRRRELFCSRDRFGAKPFYYRLDAESLVFASEIKAILTALDQRPRPNPRVVADYLVGGRVCRTEETFFAGIERLEAAHNLVVSATAERKQRYWDYTTESHAYDLRDPVATFRELLDDAVRLRLRSDVPVGVALSGGLDSTTLLALATRERSAPSRGGSAPEAGAPRAFTAIFPGDRFDEHDHARFAAEHCGAELFTVAYSPDRLVDDLRTVVWHLDYPALLPQVLPRWSLMRLAAERVKVILEGQGADELLAGYVGAYARPYLEDQWSRLRSGDRADAARDVAAAAAALFRAHGIGGYALMARRELRKLLPKPGGWSRDLAAIERERPAVDSQPAAPLFPDRLTRKMHDDHSRAQLPMLLKFGDAISMAHSLESRLPFLDYRLVELAFQLPVRHKFHRGRSKAVLREATAGVVPDRIRWRRDKVGFDTPIQRWIAARLDDEVGPLLLSEAATQRGVFDPGRLRQLLTPRALESPAVGQQVFQCLSVELWFRLFIDGEGAPTSASRSSSAPAPGEAVAVGAAGAAA